MCYRYACQIPTMHSDCRSKNCLLKMSFFNFNLIIFHFFSSQICKTGNSEAKSIFKQMQKKNFFNFNFSLSTFNFNFFICSFSLKIKKILCQKRLSYDLFCSSYFLL